MSRDPPGGVSPLVAAAAVALAAALLLPSLARGAELVAEAAFLSDTLPLAAEAEPATLFVQLARGI